MRPASKATDTSVSCTACRSTVAIVCAVGSAKIGGCARRRRCFDGGESFGFWSLREVNGDGWWGGGVAGQRRG